MPKPILPRRNVRGDVDGLSSYFGPLRSPATEPPPGAHATTHESGGGDEVHHDQLTGFVTAEHVDHTGVTLTAGDGLTGGGDISASRTLAVGAGAGITVNADTVALTTPGTLTVGSVNAAAGNHTHAVTSSANPGAASSLLRSTVTGGLQLVDLTLSGNFDPYRIDDHLIPRLTDTYDLGTSTLLWRKGWLSELDTIIFAENTITLLGGWFYITKYAGTTAEAVDTSQTQIDLGADNGVMRNGDWIVFRQSLQVEYMRLGSYVGANVWNVTRNADGSGANAWPEGAPYACFGQEGDGRIELNAYDTPRISISKHGAAYNAQTELIRLGDLNGLADYSSEEYGIFIGDYSGDRWLAYDQTNSLRIRGDALIEGTVDATKFATSIGEQFFSASDGLLLLGPDCAITSTAWTSLRGQVASIGGAFHQTAGRWPGTRSLMVEESATNFIVNPIFENDVSTGWSFAQGGSGGSVVQSTDYVRYGTHSAKMTMGDAYTWFTEDGISSGAGGNVAISAYVRPSEAGGALILRDLTNGVDRATTTFTHAGGWRRVTTTWTNTTGGTVTVVPRFSKGSMSAGSLLYIDGVQLETSPYPTSFVYGGMAWGAWSGAAHNSTSTRAETNISLDDHAALLNGNDTWSAGIWWQPSYDSDADWPDRSLLLDVRGANDDNRVYIEYEDADDTYHVFIRGADQFQSAAQDFSAGQWQHVVLTLDFPNDVYVLYVNGEEAGRSTTPLTFIGATTIRLGGSYATHNHANAAYAELALFDSALTAAQAAAYYHRDAPLIDTGAMDTPGVYILDGRFSLATSTSGARTMIDPTGWWAYDAGGNAAFGLSLADGVSWGGFTMNQSDIILGHNQSGSAAIRWDQSTGRFGFYGNGDATPQVVVDTNGRLTAGGGRIVLDDTRQVIYSDGDGTSNPLVFINSQVTAGTSGFINMQKTDYVTGASTGYIDIGIYNDVNNQCSWSFRLNGADLLFKDSGNWRYVMETTYDYVLFNAPPRVATGTADPTTGIEDGMLFYRTDTDKLRLRANGAWVNLN